MLGHGAKESRKIIVRQERGGGAGQERKLFSLGGAIQFRSQPFLNRRKLVSFRLSRGLLWDSKDLKGAIEFTRIRPYPDKAGGFPCLVEG